MNTLENPKWPRSRKSIHSPMGESSPPSRQSPISAQKPLNRSKPSYSEDDSDNELDSFDRSGKIGSLNTTRSSNRSSHEFIEHEQIVTTRTRRTANDDSYRYNEERKLEISRTETTTSDPKIIYLAVLIAAILVGIAMYIIIPAKSLPTKRIECPQFKELMQYFNNQDITLWKSLKVNIENVVNQTPAAPSVFLLAYHDAATSKNVMAKILNATANCMKSNDPIQLDGGTFATDAMIQDYGEIITAYRKRLENEGIMYVADLHKLPAAAAQAFHTICDTFTPFVERSVIFFSMYVDQYDGKDMSPKKIHYLVETQLENNWNDINHNTLKALIGRITDQVFLLHSEKLLID
ncbi:uncharacterized protein LOC116346947 [Contarinia nasturtii]|uniref:uncharacterized protein LOC116346947 n=1 Tax=Contarinia nasturtii TaxID=265458 RepID=UPI0012D43421|nr:uncharacterized protein LOC116346947 [Contarinia nasturtii]